MSSTAKSHPLAPPDDNDDFDDYADIIEINMGKHKPVLTATDNTSLTQVKQSGSSQSLPLPPKVPIKKRPAPAPPNQQLTALSVSNLSSSSKQEKTSDEQSSSLLNSISGGADCCFFIDVHHVRWFYKGEKSNEKSDKESVPTSSSAAITGSLPSIPSNSILPGESLNEMSSSTYSAASSDLHNNVSNLLSNSAVNVHHISSKKWIMFSKRDSYNLELEYRDMITKKLTNINSEPPKSVQVLDSLYEVNLTTKRLVNFSILGKTCL